MLITKECNPAATQAKLLLLNIPCSPVQGVIISALDIDDNLLTSIENRTVIHHQMSWFTVSECDKKNREYGVENGLMLCSTIESDDPLVDSSLYIVRHNDVLDLVKAYLNEVGDWVAESVSSRTKFCMPSIKSALSQHGAVEGVVTAQLSILA